MHRWNARRPAQDGRRPFSSQRQLAIVLLPRLFRLSRPHRLFALGLDQGLDRFSHGRPQLVMPALATDRIGGGPLHAAVLDFVGEPEHRCDAGKCRGWRRGEAPICLVDDATRVAAALPRLLHNGEPYPWSRSASSCASIASPWAASAACFSAISAKAGSVVAASVFGMAAAIGMATAARLPALMILAPAARGIKPRRVGATGLAGVIADVFVGGVLCTRVALAMGLGSFVVRVRARAEVATFPSACLC